MTVLYPSVKVFHNNWYLLGFSCNFKSKKYYQSGVKTINIRHSVTQAGNFKTMMIPTDYVVNLEFDTFILFPSLLWCLIAVLHFFVCKGKVKNREETLSRGLCQDLSWESPKWAN